VQNESSSSIKLYAFPTSPYAIKVACTLAFKKIDYEFVGVSPITFKQVKFTGKRQVPVLQISEKWKLESSEIGYWIDEQFPDAPLLGTSSKERAQIIALDNWVSERLIPSVFRLIVDWPSIGTGVSNGWKLAKAVHFATPLPIWVRMMWPFLIRRAPFIASIVEGLDRSKSLQDSQSELITEFVELLDDGPYMGGMEMPSLADISAYSSIVFPFRFGLEGDANWFDNPRVVEWINNINQYLPDNPFLVGDDLLSRGYSDKA